MSRRARQFTELEEEEEEEEQEEEAAELLLDTISAQVEVEVDDDKTPTQEDYPPRNFNTTPRPALLREASSAISSPAPKVPQLIVPTPRRVVTVVGSAPSSTFSPQQLPAESPSLEICSPSYGHPTTSGVSQRLIDFAGDLATEREQDRLVEFLQEDLRLHSSAQNFPQMATVSSGAQAAVPPMSPLSSPRLPSPPPFTEVQFGPKSPTIGDGVGDKDKLFGVAMRQDDGANRRIRPGTKAADMASGPPLVPLSQLDSPFQLQEHLKALYHHHTKSPSGNLIPITREVATNLAEPPEGVERSLWLYELCRFLVMKANNLIVAFFSENPPCSAQTCTEMRASEWQYLCAVHDPPKSCCAIDYCCHTLDWAANTLTSPKYFPSRLTLGSESAGGPQASMRHLTNIFRRVYRIFAHAWFQHRAVFWQVEGHDGLYMFFKTVCDVYKLIPEDNYTIPAEAEGDFNLETPIETRSPQPGPHGIFKNPTSDLEAAAAAQLAVTEDGEPTTTVSTGATTRRHKHTPSTGTLVNPIVETVEEDENMADTAITHAEPEEGTAGEPGTATEEAGDVEKGASKDVGHEQDEEDVARGVASLGIGDTENAGEGDAEHDKDAAAVKDAENDMKSTADTAAAEPEKKGDEADDRPEASSAAPPSEGSS